MKKIIIFNHKMSLLYDDLYNYIEKTNNLETDNDIINIEGINGVLVGDISSDIKKVERIIQRV